ncbi:MAG TPA: heavy metal translocating P-type ATPase [Acidobacteriaceae bacterium]|nr:heavy metal translocating P-type ATPase [Acidobacteriaceae bacterium]
MRSILRHIKNHEAASGFAISAVIAAGMLASGAVRLVWGAIPLASHILLGAVAIAAIPICIDLVREILKGNFSVDLLAVLSIGTAVVLHQYWVAAIVILMLSGGKSLEEFATRRASNVLGALSNRMPRIAHRLNEGGAVVDVRTEELKVQDHIVLYPHELCPVDGIVLSGHGNMDESFLTGEPFSIAKAPGANVISGAVNGNSALTILATRPAADSRYARIVEVLHASEEKRPQIRRLADRLSIWYTPAAISLALASWLFTHQPERFLSVLVIATPCPLILAIPVAVIGAISVGAKRGIVIKDPSILEKIDSCRTLIVDKTGTLTYGTPTLSEVAVLGDWKDSDLLKLAASVERYSKHPLASAVIEASNRSGGTVPIADDVSEQPGKGLKGHVAGHTILITGRSSLSPQMTQQLPPVSPGLECVVLVNDRLAGLLRFVDAPRKDSRPFLHHLGIRHNIKDVILLSGDRPAEVSLFAAGMGIPTSYGGKSPEEKLAIVREVTARSPTLYIGDGINDAPAMMNATAGVALGVHSEITSEAAGAVIMQASLLSVDELIHIGRRMRRIAITSAAGGMLLSFAGMVAASAGYLLPIQGAILQEAVDLLSILNSLRMILPTGALSDFDSTARQGTSVDIGPPASAASK